MRIVLVPTLAIIAAASLLTAETAAGIKWVAPKGWVSKGESAMRAATYTVADSECVVYFFGPGQGGGVDANIARWSGQFTTAAGKPAPAKVTKSTTHGLPVTLIDVTGNYSGGMTPTGAAGAATGGTRMLAAIVEGPGGNLFVKLTGPAAGIAAQQAAFNALLASFEKR